MDTSTEIDRPTYVYGVLEATAKPPAAAGIAGASLELVADGEVAALVSRLPSEQLRLGREELKTHSSVLEQALEQGTVLPMRFGVVMEGEQAVRRELLAAHRQQLAEQLERLAGMVELKLRAIYDEGALLRQAVAENRQIAERRRALRGLSEDATYYLRIELGELVAQAVQQIRERDAELILGALEPLARASVVGDPGHERVALNASFLLARGEVERFDEAVEQIGREQAERMRLKYTGPLPPHSFVDLERQG
jgi:hypothetical protein